jgi:uncharacterized membrane protein
MIFELIWKIIHAVLGIAFALFIPGFLLTLILMKDLDKIERFAFSVCFSVCITIFLGLFLGFNETMANITGGITEWNIWLYFIGISLALFLVYMIRNNKKKN